MRVFKSFRQKSKSHNHDEGSKGFASMYNDVSIYTSSAPSPTSAFSTNILSKALSYVCPHSQDSSYDTSEESSIESACALCDLKDLAQCSLVSRQWEDAVRPLLYGNVRIDAVHYCGRESELVTLRHRRSFGGRSGETRDPVQERLQLFARTVRDRGRLACLVQTLRLPFMTRETCKADLARTISVLTNLRYVDLPEGVFKDSTSSKVLTQELRASCPDLRRMTFATGAESAFASFGQGHFWRNIEQLHLCGLGTDTHSVVTALTSLKALQSLQLKQLVQFGDEALSPSVDFPPLQAMELCDLPSLSVDGLLAYVSRPMVSKSLTSLKLVNTAVKVTSLHSVLNLCQSLATLHIVEKVDRPFPLTGVPTLKSPSLKCLTFEVSAGFEQTHGVIPLAESYYMYLASSILEGCFPALIHLYALSATLPAMLQRQTQSRSSPTEIMEGNSTTHHPSLDHALHLYTKAVAELEWDLTVIYPSIMGATLHSKTRPMSLYAPVARPRWENLGRKSVMVGNGFGGFLMVPKEAKPPISAGRTSPRKERDAWMG